MSLCRLQPLVWAESDRERAICQFCDTDFVGTDGPGGGKFRYGGGCVFGDAVLSCWSAHAQSSPERRFVVLTGGEPLLQSGFAASAGTACAWLFSSRSRQTERSRFHGSAADCIDWVCMSPKAGTDIVVTRGDELKLIFPQPGVEPERFAEFAFAHHLLQPMDGPRKAERTAAAIAYCQRHPTWRLSLQTHKLLGIP